MSQTTTTIQEEELIQFTLNDTMVSMKLEFVERINLQEKIIPIPRSPSQVVGVAKIENNIIPILSLEKFLKTKTNGNEDKSNKVLIVTTISDATFALQTSSIPKVFRGTLSSSKKKNSSFSFIPEKWIDSIVTDANNNELPVLNPNEFWLGLAAGGVTGLGITDVDIAQSSTKTKEKKDEKPIEIRELPNEAAKEDKNITNKKEKLPEAEEIQEEEPKKKTKRRGRRKKSEDGDESDSDDEEESESEE